MTRSRRFALAFIASVATFTTGSVLAQAAYPSKPIKVVVPFPAGSTTDIIARAIADKMSQSMGQPWSLITAAAPVAPLVRRRWPHQLLTVTPSWFIRPRTRSVHPRLPSYRSIP